MPQKTKYFFGRLNLAANYEEGDYDEKTEILVAGLTEGNVVNWYGYKYIFIEHEQFEDQDMGTFLTGRLVKFKPVENEEVIDLDAQELASDDIFNKTAAKIRFFLHVKTGLIVHHAAGQQLAPEQFRMRFADLLEDAHGDFFINAAVEAVTERHEIFEAMRRFQTIRKVEIELHPSNPNSQDYWEEVDNRLQNLKLDRYREEYETRAGSLDVRDDGDVKKKLSMADDGYGAGKIEGVDENGDEKTITTGDQPITTSASREDSETTTDSLFTQLRESIREVMSRFANDV